MTRIVIGILLILAGLFWMADMLLGIDLGWRWLPGVLLIIIGLSLLTRSASSTSHSGTITAGVLVLLVGLVMPGSDVTWSLPDDWEIGQETLQPETISDGDELTHGVGEFTVDLTNTEISSGESELTISNGIGKLTVIPPCDATSIITATNGIGNVRDEASGDEDNPFGAELTVTTDRSGRSELTVDASNGIGEVVIGEPACPITFPSIGDWNLGSIDQSDIEDEIGDLLGDVGADFSIDRDGPRLQLELGDEWPEGFEDELNDELDKLLTDPTQPDGTATDNETTGASA